MRVLLDECLPAGLRRDLPGYEVTTVQRMGWAGTKNGALLPLVGDAGFAAFVTIDRAIEFQQRVAALPSNGYNADGVLTHGLHARRRTCRYKFR